MNLQEWGHTLWDNPEFVVQHPLHIVLATVAISQGIWNSDAWGRINNQTQGTLTSEEGFLVINRYGENKLDMFFLQKNIII